MTTKHKFRVSTGMLSYIKPIEKVEVVSETQNLITYIDTWYSPTFQKRVAKKTQYASFFDTYDEAKSFLIDYLKRKVTAAQSTLDREKAALKRINDIIQKEVL